MKLININNLQIGDWIQYCLKEYADGIIQIVGEIIKTDDENLFVKTDIIFKRETLYYFPQEISEVNFKRNIIYKLNKKEIKEIMNKTILRILEISNGN